MHGATIKIINAKNSFIVERKVLFCLLLLLLLIIIKLVSISCLAVPLFRLWLSICWSNLYIHRIQMWQILRKFVFRNYPFSATIQSTEYNICFPVWTFILICPDGNETFFFIYGANFLWHIWSPINLPYDHQSISRMITNQSLVWSPIKIPYDHQSISRMITNQSPYSQVLKNCPLIHFLFHNLFYSCSPWNVFNVMQIKHSTINFTFTSVACPDLLKR
jgi:hypothetical protein